MIIKRLTFFYNFYPWLYLSTRYKALLKWVLSNVWCIHFLEVWNNFYTNAMYRCQFFYDIRPSLSPPFFGSLIVSSYLVLVVAFET